MKGKGYFGEYGGVFVPETLVPALEELENKFLEARGDESFLKLLDGERRNYAGRPTPITHAQNLSTELGCEVFLKREDLCHSGAHKINNALGQGLLAKRMGKQRLIAETGAGQHGVAVATAAARLGLKADVYMGSVDAERQKPNVFRMKLLGASVTTVEAGAKTLKDAINECLRDWTENVRKTHYVLGSALGPHPYPEIVSFFQSVIGREARKQMLDMNGRLPDVVVACVGGGSNAIGIFREFLQDDGVKLVGVEAGGLGLESGRHAARLCGARESCAGVLHGTRTLVLQDCDGQIAETHSVSAGLDYPAVGPEHAFLRDSKRAEYDYATDEEALQAFERLSNTEGIIPAMESSHALAWVVKCKDELRGKCVLLNLSGRGDKDVFHVARIRGDEIG